MEIDLSLFNTVLCVIVGVLFLMYFAKKVLAVLFCIVAVFMWLCLPIMCIVFTVLEKILSIIRRK